MAKVISHPYPEEGDPRLQQNFEIHLGPLYGSESRPLRRGTPDTASPQDTQPQQAKPAKRVRRGRRRQ